ncbi:MAG: serine O-acetyltransferase [Aquiluna sp.]|nr:serine O-acetyltransferase [Aquiluna sp.]
MSIKGDIRAGLERDPATLTAWELFFTSGGLHAIWIYRLAHKLWTLKLRTLSRMFSNHAKFFTGIEIHPGAVIGKRLVIDHGIGVVIGETAVIGDDVLIYHGVTLGGKTLDAVKRHPTVGDRVIIGAGAKLIGNIKVGNDCAVGANAVVTKDMPPGTVAVGVNARLLNLTGDDFYII